MISISIIVATQAALATAIAALVVNLQAIEAPLAQTDRLRAEIDLRIRGINQARADLIAGQTAAQVGATATVHWQQWRNGNAPEAWIARGMQDVVIADGGTP